MLVHDGIDPEPSERSSSFEHLGKTENFKKEARIRSMRMDRSEQMRELAATVDLEWPRIGWHIEE